MWLCFISSPLFTTPIHCRAPIDLGAALLLQHELDGTPPHCRNTRNTAIDGKKKMQILIAALVAREEKGLKLEPSLLHPNSTGKMCMGPLEGFESRGQCASIAFHAQLCPQGTLYSTVSFPHEELSPAAIAAFCCCLLLPCITVTICQTSPVANMSDTHIKKLLKPAGN